MFHNELKKFGLTPHSNTCATEYNVFYMLQSNIQKMAWFSVLILEWISM